MWTCNRSRKQTTRDVLSLSFVILLMAFAKSAAAQLSSIHVDDFTGHPRVIIISDIGNEPDDQMSLVRFLMYSNELDIEGLIPTTSTWQKARRWPSVATAMTFLPSTTSNRPFR